MHFFLTHNAKYLRVFALQLLLSPRVFRSIPLRQPACKVGVGGNRFLNQCSMNRGPYSYSVRCARLRQTEMPKEPRGVPTVTTGSLTAHRTRPRGSACFLKHATPSATRSKENSHGSSPIFTEFLKRSTETLLGVRSIRDDPWPVFSRRLRLLLHRDVGRLGSVQLVVHLNGHGFAVGRDRHFG